ncbi:MAG: division/cell wall cluster transcriptional repressor MraZ [Elusimicrobia bacterium]|nr:division/cell wall cluster transcriptional repressor MraZ [Elusimicrobiota bacterium]
MFLGTYEHAIDPKGRLFIPAKLRAAGSSTYIVTRGLETCLYIFDQKKFEDVIGKLSTLPVKNQQDARAFKRMLLAGAHDVTIDDMGRILVPSALIDYAGLRKDVAILGVGERIELWSAAAWKAYSGRAESTFNRVGRQLEI